MDPEEQKRAEEAARALRQRLINEDIDNVATQRRLDFERRLRGQPPVIRPGLESGVRAPLPQEIPESMARVLSPEVRARLGVPAPPPAAAPPPAPAPAPPRYIPSSQTAQPPQSRVAPPVAPVRPAPPAGDLGSRVVNLGTALRRFPAEVRARDEAERMADAINAVAQPGDVVNIAPGATVPAPRPGFVFVRPQQALQVPLDTAHSYPPEQSPVSAISTLPPGSAARVGNIPVRVLPSGGVERTQRQEALPETPVRDFVQEARELAPDYARFGVGDAGASTLGGLEAILRRTFSLRDRRNTGPAEGQRPPTRTQVR